MVTFHWLAPSTPPLPNVRSPSDRSGHQQGQHRRYEPGSPHEVGTGSAAGSLLLMNRPGWNSGALASTELAWLCLSGG